MSSTMKLFEAMTSDISIENIEKMLAMIKLDKQRQERLEERYFNPQPNKTFKERYQQDVEYRKKHVNYMMTKVPCNGCGFVTARCNMTRHRRSRNHAKRMTMIASLADTVESNKKSEKRKKHELIQSKLDEIQMLLSES